MNFFLDYFGHDFTKILRKYLSEKPCFINNVGRNVD